MLHVHVMSNLICTCLCPSLPPFPPLLQMFAYAARNHCQRYGTTAEHYAKITSKNRRHGANNPRATFQVSLYIHYIVDNTPPLSFPPSLSFPSPLLLSLSPSLLPSLPPSRNLCHPVRFCQCACCVPPSPLPCQPPQAVAEQLLWCAVRNLHVPTIWRWVWQDSLAMYEGLCMYSISTLEGVCPDLQH